MKVDKGMISFVSERLGYGADLSVIAVHILGIADTSQEGVVVLVLLRVVTPLYHTDIAGNRLFPSAEAVVVMMLRIEQAEEIVVVAANIARTVACFQTELCCHDLRVEHPAVLYDLEEVGEVQRFICSGLKAKIGHFLLQTGDIVIQLLDERLRIDGLPFSVNLFLSPDMQVWAC